MPAQRTRDTLPRSLELTTAAPLSTPPTLAIIAPTPRAFNFRVSHNINDSPFTSPSSSPFEPDASGQSTLASPECSTSLSPTAVRSLSPTSHLDLPTTVSPSTNTITNRRRKSASTSDAERRPKKGDEDYIKRPENAFILFRRKCCEDRLLAQEEAATSAASESPTKKPRQADLSRTISEQWKSLSSDERQYWEDKAKEKKKEHEKLYPNYVYRPQRVKDKESKRKMKGLRGEFARITEHENISFVLPMAPSPPGRPHGRSASAPTPPLPYQAVSVPNVYLSSPSCPTSPSLIPMINRRSAHPAHDECNNVSTFDFVPNQSSINNMYGTGGFESANLQSSEYLNMYNIAQRQGLPSLEQLSLPSEASPSLLLPAHQIISPCSTNSSGSSSPRFEPYTPTSAGMFAELELASSPVMYSPGTTADGLQCSSDFEFRMGLQLQEQLQQSIDQLGQIDCSASQFAWADPNATWAVGGEMSISVDDFDLTAIPPVELGGISSKYPDESHNNMGSTVSFDGFVVGQNGSMTTLMNPHPHQYMDEMIIGFDELMAGQGF